MRFALSVLAILAAGFSPQPARAADTKPMLVLIGASWCPHCVTELATLNRMDLSAVTFRHAETDGKRPGEAEIAQQWLRGSSIPQLILVRQTSHGPEIVGRLIGGQSEASIQALIKRANE